MPDANNSESLSYDELKSFLRIKKNKLDDELVLQANDFFLVGESYANAIARRDQAKHQLDVEIAKLDKDIREGLIADEEKVTEDKVKMQLHREQDYQRMYQRYLAECLNANKWEALRDAYRQRAYVLKDLVALHVTAYYGETVGSAERHEARERVHERFRD